MPEYAKFALSCLAIAYCLNGFIDTKILMVLSDNFDGFTRGVVKEDEVLEEVEKVGFGADAFEESLHIDNAFIFFF